MMSKTISPSKRKWIYAFTLSFLSVTALLFCSSYESNDQRFIKAFSSDALYSEPDVFLKINSDGKSDGYWYNSEGKYISDIVQLYQLDNGLVTRKDSVIDGLVHKTMFLDESGRSTNVILKEYSQSKLKHETSWLMGNLFWKNSYHSDTLMTSKQYYSDGE